MLPFIALKPSALAGSPQQPWSRRALPGFTLFELVVVLAIFGILTALIAPGIMGLRHRFQVQAAFDQIRQTLREAQAEAIRSGQSCTVTLNVSAQPIQITAQFTPSRPTPSPGSPSPNPFPIVIPAPAPCGINRTLPDQIQISHNLSATPPQVTFSYQGGILLTNNNQFTSVVYSSTHPELEKPCFVLSPGIGIMRTGNYTQEIPIADPTATPDPNATPNPDSCQAQLSPP